MKRTVLLLIFLVAFTANCIAQNQLNLGVNVSTAVNDYFGDPNVGVGADLTYLFPINEK